MKTTKKFFAVVLAVMMIVAMIPTTVAFAADETVAKIGDVEYASLQAAVDAAKAGDTVTLVADTDTGALVNKSITFDLGEYSINTTGQYGILAYDDANVTINATTGGIAQAGTGSCVAVWAAHYSSITVNGGNYSVKGYNSTVYQEGSGTITITDGYFKGDKPYNGKYYVLNISNSATGSIVVTGGQYLNLDPSAGDDSLGGTFLAEGYDSVASTTDDGTLYTVKKVIATVNGTNYYTLQSAVNAAAAGDTVTLVADTDTGATVGKSITFDLGENSINTTGQYGILAYGDANVTINATTGGIAQAGTGSCVAVWAAHYSSITVNGGNYSVKGYNSTVYQEGSGTITITDGYFKGDKPYNGKYYVLNTNNKATGTIQVSGGKYVNQDPEGGDDFLKGNYLVVPGYKSVKTTVNDVVIYTVIAEEESAAEVEMTPETEDTLGVTFQKSLELVGVQKKADSDTNDMRFVSVINSDLIENATDYGYIIGTTSKDKAQAMSEAAKITLENASKYKVSCKETSNQISGAYGEYESDTNYKYVTAAVENITNTSKTIFARVYVTLEDGTTLYGKYITVDETEYDGCASSYAELG
jgi:hypothetical protein